MNTAGGGPVDAVEGDGLAEIIEDFEAEHGSLTRADINAARAELRGD